MEHWFDDLARSIAGGLSRRAALRRIGVGIAGGLLGSFLGGQAWAQPQRVCQPGEAACGPRCCPAGQACCGGRCTRLDSVQNCGACGVSCGAGATCQGGRCVGSAPAVQGACPPGQVQCPTGCVDTSTDPLNCGSCGAVCGQGNENYQVLCEAGVCTRGPDFP